MGKMLSILGACAVVSGGVVFGLSSYSRHTCDRADLASCPVAEGGGCCPAPVDVNASADEAPALAVAGAAALFSTTPVSAEAKSCCATKAVAKAGCCEEKVGCCEEAKTVAVHACCEAAPTATGLVALTGTAATQAKK